MRFLARPPSPPLSPFIENLWSLSDAPEHAKERIVPSGTLELVINLHEDELRIYDSVEIGRCRRFSGAIVSGAYGKPFVIDTREHASIVGVHFKPGGAFPFLGVPADELADAHVDLEVLWGPAATELRERLCAASTTARRFRLLEDYLMKHLRLRHQRGAVRFALDHLGGDGSSVARIAAHLGLSHRRFIEVFAAEVGITPKRFGRVRRFQRALSLTLRAREPDWTQVALECGYYDHAHLIRDFVAFSGFAPAKFLRHQSRDVKVNHVALP